MFLLPEEDLKHIWQKAERCIPLLQNANIFLTGGTGFFGRWLLESVYYANDMFSLNTKVMMLTRDLNAFYRHSPHLIEAKWLSVMTGDVRYFTFPDTSFTHIIHAATDASAKLNQHNPLLMFDTIIQGTRRVLEFAAAREIKNFLFTSSGAVYGKQPPALTHVPETYLGVPAPWEPNSAYGMGKLTAEHLCALFFKQYGIDVKIARCFAFVGPLLPLSTHFAIGNFMFNALNHQAIHIQGDGTPFRSYLYAADLIIWLLIILCHGKAGQAYNVGSDQAVSIKELAELVAATTSPVLAVNLTKPGYPAMLAERYVPNIIKAKEELGLQPWIHLKDAIKKTIYFWESVK